MQKQPLIYAVLAQNFRAKNPQWFRMEKSSNSDVADVYIYDAIDSYWGVAAEDFVKSLKSIDAKAITIHINSPGGSVFDGMAMYHAIKSHPAKVTAVVEGLSASIATIIMLAADEVQVAEGSMVMIHNPWGFSMGDAEEMRNTADILDKIAAQMAGIYAGVMGKSQEEILAIMAAETWYTAEEAVAAGLATAKAQVAAKAQAFDLSVFKNAPRSAEPAEPTETVQQPNEELLRARMRLMLAERE